MVPTPSFRQRLMDTIVQSYRFIYTWRRDLWRLTWPFVVLEWIYLWAQLYAMGGPGHSESTPASLYFMFLAAATLVPYAARIQGFVLDPQPVTAWRAPGMKSFLKAWARGLLHYLVPALGLMIGVSLLMLIVSNPAVEGLTPANFLLGLVMTGGLALVMTRFAFMLPLSLEGRSDQFARSWALTRGHFAFLFLLYGLATVPMRLLYRLAEALGLWIEGLPDLSLAAKTGLHFYLVLLPSAAAIMGQLLIALVALTLVYKSTRGQAEAPLLARGI